MAKNRQQLKALLFFKNLKMIKTTIDTNKPTNLEEGGVSLDHDISTKKTQLSLQMNLVLPFFSSINFITYSQLLKAMECKKHTTHNHEKMINIEYEAIIYRTCKISLRYLRKWERAKNDSTPTNELQSTQ